MNYYEYAKKEFNTETCEYCKKFSRCPEDDTNCEYCEVKIIIELIKMIDAFKVLLDYPPYPTEVPTNEVQTNN